MKRAMEDGLSLLAGAGIGMAIMYLMDPETGEQRRARLARKANEAMGGAGEYLGSAVAGASSAASRFGENVGDRFSDAGDSISGAAQSART